MGSTVTEPTNPAPHAQQDELIVVRCQLGERAAFDELIDRWHQPLWKYVRRLARDDDAASEVVQDVWVRVIRGLGRLRDGSRLRPWLFGIARRTLMDRLRSQYAEPRAADEPSEDLAAADDSTTLDPADDDLDRMHEELSRLPAVEQEALTLFYLRELSLAQIAEVLGVPVGTVKSRLFRARRLLRAALIQRGLVP